MTAAPRLAGLLGLSLLLLAPLASAAAEKYDPFKIPRDQFYAEVTRIAVEPLVLPSNTAEPEALRAQFEAYVRTALEEYGFQVIPSVEFERRWNELAEKMGGLYDPVSGKGDDEKLKIVHKLVREDLAASFGADATLRSLISFGELDVWAKDVTVDQQGTPTSYVSWMAATEPVTWRGAPIKAFYANRPQRVTGARFSAFIFGLGQAMLYDIMVPIRWSRVYVMGSYEERPDGEALGDKELNRRAVRAALDDLGRSDSDP